uniref:TROVE domain-containing protein n=1 Tax=Ditylum brightwellii TaxID=49249 RepID=A0A7S1Z7U1_9STRA
MKRSISTTASDTSSSAKHISSPFRNAVIADHHSKRLGENACPEYTSLGLNSNTLAISQLVRGGNPTSLINDDLATKDIKYISDLFILLFSTRNSRGGKGEKMLSYQMFFALKNQYPSTALAMLPLFAHYGYWKDLLLISNMAASVDYDLSKSESDRTVNECIKIMQTQLMTDLGAVEQYEVQLSSAKDEKDIRSVKQKGPKISLLAKWLPREGSKLDKKVGFVEKFAAAVWPDASINDKGMDKWKSSQKAKYRRTVSKLTAFLELPEVLLSAKRADEINFHKVASKATLRLSRAFLNEDMNGNQRSHDAKRIRLSEIFIDHMVSKGLKGGQISPHEIVREVMNDHSITRAREMVLDAQWKDLWKKVVKEVEEKAKEEGLAFNPTQMVPLSDVSGSMYGTPMEVSIALGIGVSEITHPAFRNMVLTFDSIPQWHHLKATDTIVQKVRSLQNAPWGYSTNFEAAFDLILSSVEDHKLSYEDVPSLIVFSDMQFDQAHTSNSMDTMFDHIKANFVRTASKLKWTESDLKPIVFWNLRNTDGHPVSKDTPGTVLLSGFSPSLLKMVLNGAALQEEEIEVIQKDGTVVTEKIRVTPEEVLRKILDDSMYDPVREVLSRSDEGVFKGGNDTKDWTKEEAKEEASDGFEDDYMIVS